VGYEFYSTFYSTEGSEVKNGRKEEGFKKLGGDKKMKKRNRRVVIGTVFVVALFMMATSVPAISMQGESAKKRSR